MKVIIAGSRGIESFEEVQKAITDSEFEITQVVSGGARGVDKLGERWAVLNIKGKQPYKRFPANWDDLSHPDSVMKFTRFGKPYNHNAGFIRNEEMAEYADALIAVWNGVSGGTADMIGRATAHGLKIYIHYVPKQNEETR